MSADQEKQIWAFPCPQRDSDSSPGMTLRDYLAASVIQGAKPWEHVIGEYAEWAYKMADAMLLERDKK